MAKKIKSEKRKVMKVEIEKLKRLGLVRDTYKYYIPGTPRMIPG